MTEQLSPLTAPVAVELLDAMPFLAWTLQFDGQMEWQSVRCRTELAPDAIEALAAGAEWQAAMAAGVAFERRETLHGRDGSQWTATVRMAPEHDADGRACRWFGTVGDTDARQRAENARDATQAELDTLTNAMPQMVWATRPDGFHDYYNAQWYRFTGVPEGSTDGEEWNGMFHPDDQERAWARWHHSLATGDPYEIEYRLRHHSGEYRWTLGRALPVRDAEGRIVRWIGTCTDIDAAKRIADESEILSRELSHRIKNIFAVISGLIRLSARRTPEARGFADALVARVGALAAAHDLARPHSEQSRPEVGDATLHHVLRELMSPYGAERTRLSGRDVPIDDRGATPIALVFHELATNAAKYGALSVPDGVVTIETGIADEVLSIVWREQGGPPVPAAPTTTGFGTKLAALSIEQQLNGRIHRDWHADGLVVTIEIRPTSIVRD